MTSANLQPYNVPFSGLVPPIRPESTLNDEFKAQHPVAALPYGMAPDVCSISRSGRFGIRVSF